MNFRVSRAAVSSLLLPISLSAAARAATYAAIADAELARRSPVIVLAEALEEETRVESIDGSLFPFTLARLKRLEVLKGTISEEAFRVRLPGGMQGEVSWWVPGVPSFLPEQRAVLFLAPREGFPGEYHLTELALSKFDVLEDSERSLFAVRSIFQSGEERLLSADASEEVAPDEVRDLEAFLGALRAAGRGEPLPQTVYRQPRGALRPVTRGKTPLWVNIGGREPGGGCTSMGVAIPCLFRWFWDTGISPDGVVQVNGTQPGLSDGTDGVAHVGSAIASWTAIPGTTVRYNGPAASGNVTVNIGVSNDPGGSWTGPYDCSGGTLGVGGPRNASGPREFKGDTTYYAPRGGNVSIRPWACVRPQPASTYMAVVVHELGHTLGLGHPDTAQSVHSTTTSEQDWDNAVMRSTVRASITTPQRDDIEAILYYYGGTAPAASFGFAPAVPAVRQPVSFTDTSAGSPDSWSWAFGDGDTSTERNPTHAYLAPGTYGVTLTARNALGASASSRSITVGAPASVCASALSNLCFNAGRFAVTLLARDQRTERIGPGQAIPQNDLFGYFSIPALTNDPTNPEVFVKVLDGTAFNGSFWVFYGGLTDLEYTITVLDLATGRVKPYTKEAGSSCGGFDTSAFPNSASSSGAAAASAALPASGSASADCPSSATALCLNSAHSFSVTLSARDQRTDTTGAGQAIPQNDLFGYFSIPALTNNPANPEVFVKVLNGTAFNGKYWVFYGGLTDLEYTLTVTENATGRVKTYTKPAGSACGGFDTEAF